MPSEKEMERLELRKWWVLGHLTDEELEEMEYVHVFGSDRCTSEGLSALMITKGDRNVYGTGYNSMVCSAKSPAKILYDDEYDLERNVKIDELCGVGLKKIVVGFQFGAGLTTDNDIFIWGEGPDIVVSKARSVCFEVYSPKAPCSKCSKPYSGFKIGGFLLNKCHKCNFLPAYNRSTPPCGIPLRRLVMAYNVFVSCLSCGEICQSLHVGGYDINYCMTCDLLRELSFRDVLSLSSYAPRKVVLPKTIQVLDIECGRTFLLIRTYDNRLFVWGSLGCTFYKCCIQNPDNIVIRSVSCGGNHIAVLSYHGDVYTCGFGNLGQLGYPWMELEGHLVLRRVSLPGRVVKVSCRSSGTTCLLNDHSVYCWGTHIRKLGRSQISISLSAADIIISPVKISGKFTDITSSPLTNVFCAKTEPLVYTWGVVVRNPQSRRHQQVRRISASECISALVDRPVTYSSSALKRSFVFIRRYIPECTVHSGFYGTTMFSDITFKLSDGKIPAHTLVLHTNSVYFKKLFTEKDEMPKEIDVTNYNPVAYRNLLKHLYGVQVDEERVDDLFDLYAIATSYNETGIIEDTGSRLREAIYAHNVLHIHAKAKSAGFQEIADECELFMDTPEFKNMLVRLIARDSQKSLQALAMITDNDQ